MGRDFDLLVFAAEQSPDDVKKLVAAARALPCPPHLVGLGRFAYTEAAVAAIQGRTGLLLERDADPASAKASLLQAGARRRREVRAEALGRLLREIGLVLEPSVSRPQ